MMEKIQEYLLRAFLSVIVSAFVLAPLVALVTAAATNSTLTTRFGVGIGVLVAVAAFFTPWARDGAKDWVKGMAAKEELRVAELKRQNEWAAKERERIAKSPKAAL